MYAERLNAIYQNPKDFSWQVQSDKARTQSLPAEYEDLRLYIGDIASSILSPEETWNPE